MAKAKESIRIEVDPEVKEKLQKLAKDQNRSMTNYLVVVIDQKWQEKNLSQALQTAAHNTQAKRTKSERPSFMGLCPFHKDTHPSLWIYEDGYFCLACNAQGTLDELNAHFSESQQLSE